MKCNKYKPKPVSNMNIISANTCTVYYLYEVCWL